MFVPDRSGFAVFRNETFLNYGVVATVRQAGFEQREFISGLDVYPGVLDHDRTHHLYFPLMRTDGAETRFGWDPITEDERTPEGELLTGVFELPDSLKEYQQDFPGRLWLGMVAYETEVRNVNAQVITDFEGGALPPLVAGFHEGGEMQAAARHNITPWFIGEHLGRVRLDQEKDTVNIDRTCTRLSDDGMALILEGEVLAADLSVREAAEAEHLAAWQPALEGVYDRVYCPQPISCSTPHYSVQLPRKPKGRRPNHRKRY